jgi:hypothetical protein
MKLSVHEATPNNIRSVVKSLLDFSVDKILANLEAK